MHVLHTSHILVYKSLYSRLISFFFVVVTTSKLHMYLKCCSLVEESISEFVTFVIGKEQTFWNVWLLLSIYTLPQVSEFSNNITAHQESRSLFVLLKLNILSGQKMSFFIFQTILTNEVTGFTEDQVPLFPL